MKVTIDKPTGSVKHGQQYTLSGMITWDILDSSEPTPYMVKVTIQGANPIQSTEGAVARGNSPLPWTTATFYPSRLIFPSVGKYTVSVKVLDADFGPIVSAVKEFTVI